MTVPRRFGVLRFIGTLLKVIAWIVLILSILGAIGMVVGSSQLGTLITNSNPALRGLFATPAGAIVTGVVVLLIGLIDFLVLYASGERIHMYLAIEENTRLTAALLLRMHQDSQQDARPSYASGFSNEPFER
jgi:hypothetical protein